jgi:hypothetical protein
VFGNGVVRSFLGRGRSFLGRWSCSRRILVLLSFSPSDAEARFLYILPPVC